MTGNGGALTRKANSRQMNGTQSLPTGQTGGLQVWDMPEALYNSGKMANRWLAGLGYAGSPVQFRENVSADEIKSVIQNGGAAVVSGAFPSVDGVLNHVVAVVGYSGDDFIIDDPWGDFRDKYATVKGNDIPMKRTEFMNLLKPVGATKKWAHLVSVNPDAGKKEKQESLAALD